MYDKYTTLIVLHCCTVVQCFRTETGYIGNNRTLEGMRVESSEFGEIVSLNLLWIF